MQPASGFRESRPPTTFMCRLRCCGKEETDEDLEVYHLASALLIVQPRNNIGQRNLMDNDAFSFFAYPTNTTVRNAAEPGRDIVLRLIYAFQLGREIYRVLLIGEPRCHSASA